MWQFIQTHHPVWWGVGSMWLLSNAIGALPTPRDGSSAFYDWFFKFTQPIGAGLPRLLAIFWPSMLTSLTGQVSKTTVPPNPPVTAAQEAK
jgi:hypothetical protein